MIRYGLYLFPPGKGEGCFYINIYKDDTFKTGWRVKLSYEIHLYIKDKALLEQIKKFFNTGAIYNTSTTSKFSITAVKDLQSIIEHFDKYSLRTKKFADYKLFKQAFTLILNKEHLTMEGLRKIAAIKATMNRGLSEELKVTFTNITLVERPSVIEAKIQDPSSLMMLDSLLRKDVYL